ncbi:hypothetical protein N8987_05500 [Crocinitomix sp.]|nr:hypothetical protein [Crocinitomix sp.]
MIYTNCWIGLGAAAFTWQYYLIFDLEVNYAVIYFAFFATILTYTFQRYVKLVNRTQVNNERLQWMQRNDLLVKAMMIVSTAGCLKALYEFNLATYAVLFFSGLLSLFYIIRLPGKVGKNLRDIPNLKIYLIAIVWASTSTFLPYLNHGVEGLPIPWLLFITNFIFIIAITIPFDIRDLHLDEAEKKTIPQLVGVNNAILISVVLLAINIPLLIFISSYFLWVSLVSLLSAIALVIGSRKYTNDLYFSFFVDGLLILQPVLLYLDIRYLEHLV